MLHQLQQKTNRQLHAISVVHLFGWVMSAFFVYTSTMTTLAVLFLASTFVLLGLIYRSRVHESRVRDLQNERK
jgi:hypothetical protein